MEYYVLDLQFFADEGAAAPAAGGAETGTAADPAAASSPVNVGDTLSDGTQVANAQVAAALNRQMKRHPEMRGVYGQNPNGQQQAAPALNGGQQTPEGEPTREQKWAEMRKGEYKDLIANDIQNAIRDRFKNQEDATQKLKSYQPMFDAMMKKTGAKSVEELQKLVLDDDSLYEEEAEEAGMPVEQYKRMMTLQKEHDEAIAREKATQEKMKLQARARDVYNQGEELKKMFPQFNLDNEMKNEKFRNLTLSGALDVKSAYLAVHGDEMIPQLMGYGMQRARQQMGQTLQAQAGRPTEGAMRSRGQSAAEPKLNPAKMTRQERNEIKRQVRLGKVVSFD